MRASVLAVSSFEIPIAPVKRESIFCLDEVRRPARSSRGEDCESGYLAPPTLTTGPRPACSGTT